MKGSALYEDALIGTLVSPHSGCRDLGCQPGTALSSAHRAAS